MGSSQSEDVELLRRQFPAWVFTRRQWEDDEVEWTVGQVMELIISYAAENVRLGPERGGGGPYAAAIVRPLGDVSNPADSPANVTVKVVGVAVNGVEFLCDPTAHAPVLAVRFSSRKLGNHDLGQDGAGPHWLISTSEPCRFCLEALKHARVFTVLYAVRGATVEKIAKQERGELPRSLKQFRLVQLPAFQPQAASVISDWRRHQDKEMLPDYNPPAPKGT